MRYHISHNSPSLAGLWERASSCSEIKKELSSLMAGSCQAKNPEELRHIFSTVWKESGCDERREYVRQMGE